MGNSSSAATSSSSAVSTSSPVPATPPLWPLRREPVVRQLFVPIQKQITCNHYESMCLLVCPDSSCGKKYPCRRCHDENEPNHLMNRYEVQKVVCKNCDTEQGVSIMCTQCDTIFAQYFCDVCNVFDNADRGYYHCFDCGICQTGGPDNNFHCKKCNTCLPLDSLNTHRCTNNANINNCPICLDDMNRSQQQAVAMACGHTIHSACYAQLMRSQHADTCPICRRRI